jgi:microcystin-dependent protein
MAEPFIGEIRMVGFNFPPKGWTFAEGQILPINTNQSLYSVYGTMYGGDGRTTFGLPDLRGRIPIHAGTGNGLPTYDIGQYGGAPTVTLQQTQIPSHTHTGSLKASDQAQNNNQASPNSLCKPALGIYDALTPDKNMHPDSIAVQNSGGGQAHDNMMPYIAVNFCVALVGLFPSRN